MIPVVNVQFLNFPNSGSELVTPNEDGSYTVLINCRLSDEQQKEAYLHALKHIHNNDFEKNCIQTIETEAHTK